MMHYLEDEERKDAERFMLMAAEAAQEATCERARCGSVIVHGGSVLGKGHNSPAGHLESQRRCACNKAALHKKVTDKTCCVHAEVRAVFDALRNHPDRIEGSTLYFARIGSGGSMEKSGKPYCTVCSKIALDIGIREFVLWHEEGICAYDTAEYNVLSFEYGGQPEGTPADK